MGRIAAELEPVDTKIYFQKTCFLGSIHKKYGTHPLVKTTHLGGAKVGSFTQKVEKVCSGMAAGNFFDYFAHHVCNFF